MKDCRAVIKFSKWEEFSFSSCRKSLMLFPDGTCIMEAVVYKSVNDVWCFFLVDKEYGVGNAPRIVCENMEQAKFIGDLLMIRRGCDIEEPFFLENNNV